MMTDRVALGRGNARFLAAARAGTARRTAGAWRARVRFTTGTAGIEVSDRRSAGGTIARLFDARAGQALGSRPAADRGALLLRVVGPDGWLSDQAKPRHGHPEELGQSRDRRVAVLTQGTAMLTQVAISRVD